MKNAKSYVQGIAIDKGVGSQALETKPWLQMALCSQGALAGSASAVAYFSLTYNAKLYTKLATTLHTYASIRLPARPVGTLSTVYTLTQNRSKTA